MGNAARRHRDVPEAEMPAVEEVDTEEQLGRQRESTLNFLHKIDKDEKEGWVAHAEELFDRYDLDKSGTLDAEEVKDLLEQFAVHITRKYDRKWGHTDMPYSKPEIQAYLIYDLDTNFDGEVSKHEFVTNIKSIVDRGDN